MYNLSDLPNKVTYCNWRIGMVFNGTEMYPVTCSITLVLICQVIMIIKY